MKDNKKLNIADIIVAIAAVVGIIATFLPWVSSTVFGITVTAKGSDGDGWITFVMFIAVLGLAVFDMLKGAKWAKITISIVAALAAVVALIKIPDILSSDGLLSMGVGLILAIVAGIVAAIMPWIPFEKK